MSERTARPWELEGVQVPSVLGFIRSGPKLFPGEVVTVVDEAWCREDQARKIVAWLNDADLSELGVDLRLDAGEGWDAAADAIESEFGVEHE